MAMETKQKNKLKLVTHNGSFHSDDVFACATLSLVLQNKKEAFEIIRSRDEDLISAGDYVFDVGGIYDEEKNRFDHHQKEFKKKRENGIMYSSFGLVWKKFGEELCGLEEAAEIIENRLVAPIDAFDNGFDLVENKHDITPYYIQYMFLSMRPTWNEEDKTYDEMFLKSVDMAKEILKREIIQAKDVILARERVLSVYKKTKDKRILILDKDYFYGDVLNEFPEPLFVIYPRTDGFFGVRAVREDPKAFKNRKDFPVEWGGLRDEELSKITGVGDAVFCHKGLFLAVAKSLDGAGQLAQIAVQS